MNRNSNNTDKELFKLWEDAGQALNDQQQLNKKNMETILNKNSSEFSSNLVRLLKMDAVFKAVMILGFVIIAAFNLSNLLVMVTALICIILGTIGIRQERVLIEGIDELKTYKGNIRDYLRKDVEFYKSNVLRYPLILSISIFLFYILGSLIYHAFRYTTIRPVEDIEDALVLMAFLLVAFVFSFAVYYPYFHSRIKHVNALIKDIDDGDKVNAHLNLERSRKRRNTILVAIAIVIGIAALLALIITFL